MKPLLNNKKAVISKIEDVELFVNVPVMGPEQKCEKQAIKPQKELDMENMNMLKSSSSKNKILTGICFITDVRGFFKYIHPNFLKLLEGVENQFFEKSIFDDSIEGLPTTIEYLVEMIQEKRTSVFIETTFKDHVFSKLQWNIAYYGGLLNFNLSELPFSVSLKDLGMKMKTSKKGTLSAEIEKIYFKIEKAKTLNNGQNFSENLLTQ